MNLKKRRDKGRKKEFKKKKEEYQSKEYTVCSITAMSCPSFTNEKQTSSLENIKKDRRANHLLSPKISSYIEMLDHFKIFVINKEMCCV